MSSYTSDKIRAWWSEKYKWLQINHPEAYKKGFKGFNTSVELNSPRMALNKTKSEHFWKASSQTQLGGWEGLTVSPPNPTTVWNSQFARNLYR